METEAKVMFKFQCDRRDSIKLLKISSFSGGSIVSLDK